MFKVDSSGVLSIHADKLTDGTVDLEIEPFNPGVPRLTAVQKLTLTVLVCQIIVINDNKLCEKLTGHKKIIFCHYQRCRTRHFTAYFG